MDEEEFMPISQLREDEFREAFDFFDKDGKGKISVQTLREIFQLAGQYPSKADLSEMIKEVQDEGEEIEFDAFLLLMRKRMKDVDTMEECIEAFRYFDKDGSGLISVHDLRSNMILLGEKLPEEDLDEIIRAADEDNDGFINYVDFVKKVVNS